MSQVLCQCGHPTDTHSLVNPYVCRHHRECQCKGFCDEAWLIDEKTIHMRPGTYPQFFTINGRQMPCPQCGSPKLKCLAYRIGPEAYEKFMARLRKHMNVQALEHGFECEDCHAFVAQGNMHAFVTKASC